jgi:hypothetical protein
MDNAMIGPFTTNQEIEEIVRTVIPSAWTGHCTHEDMRASFKEFFHFLPEHVEIKKCKVEVRDANECPICLENKKDAACVPCGHTFCWSCINDNKSLTNCPMCNVKLERKMKLY